PERHHRRPPPPTHGGLVYAPVSLRGPAGAEAAPRALRERLGDLPLRVAPRLRLTARHTPRFRPLWAGPGVFAVRRPRRRQRGAERTRYHGRSGLHILQWGHRLVHDRGKEIYVDDSEIPLGGTCAPVKAKNGKKPADRKS